MKKPQYTITALIASCCLSTLASAATVFDLTAEEAQSTGPAFGGTLSGTLDDGFLYDVNDPTAQMPSLVFNDGAYGSDIAPGSVVDLRYTLTSGPYSTTASESTIIFDLYGRRIAKNRDDDFDIVLYNGDFMTSIATISGSGIDDTTDHVRVAFDNLAIGTTFDRFQILGYDSNGLGDNNYFTIQEIRAAAIPEPSTTLLGAIIVMATCMRRRR